MIEKLPPGMRISSAYRDVNGLLEKSDYRTARERLDKDGVGEHVNSEKLRDRDLAAARAEFEKHVTEHYLREKNDALASGKPRLAATTAETGLRYCPWCGDLRQAVEEVRSTIAGIDNLGASLARVSATAGADLDMSSNRSALRDAMPHRQLLNDSPKIRADLTKVESNLASFWASRTQQRQIESSDLREFRADLALIGVTEEGQARLQSQLRLLTVSGPKLIEDNSNREAILSLVRTRAPTYPSSISDLRQAINRRLSYETRDALNNRLSRRDVDYSSLAFAEELFAAVQSTPDDRRMIAEGHRNRAQQLAGAGRASVLALIHEERLRQLDPSTANRDAGKLRATATAAFSAAGRLSVRVRIETNPADDPNVQDLARFAILQAIRQQARAHIRIAPVSIYQKSADIDIRVTSAKLFVPSVKDLSAQSSTYLSHYEDVPNPQKAILRSQLDYQRIAVSTALANLNSQINIFNINPTQFGLTMVNTARTNYSLSVDQYNSLVQLYNSTPSTISRPVYLPYVFREGTIRHGWQISGVVKVGGTESRFETNQIDSDFVRIGTRSDDKNVAYRRDDLIDIPIGTERLHE